MKRKAQNKRYHTVSGQLPPRKIARLLGLGFGLGLGLEIGLVGGGHFSSGPIVLEPYPTRVITLIIMFRNIYQIFRPITLLKHMLITNQYVA